MRIWTKDQDEILLKSTQRFIEKKEKIKWVKVAKEVNLAQKNKCITNASPLPITNIQCYKRYDVINPSIIKGVLTEKEKTFISKNYKTYSVPQLCKLMNRDRYKIRDYINKFINPILYIIDPTLPIYKLPCKPKYKTIALNDTNNDLYDDLFNKKEIGVFDDFIQSISESIET
jgi:hypothetical protein